MSPTCSTPTHKLLLSSWTSARRLTQYGIRLFCRRWLSSTYQKRSTTGWLISLVATHIAPCTMIRRRRWRQSTPASSRGRRSDRQHMWSMQAIYRQWLLKTSSSSSLMTLTSSYQLATSTEEPPRSITLRRGKKKQLDAEPHKHEGDRLCWHKEEASSYNTSYILRDWQSHVSENPQRYNDKRSVSIWSYPPHYQRLCADSLRTTSLASPWHERHGTTCYLQISRCRQVTVCVQCMGWIYYGGWSTASQRIPPPQHPLRILSFWHFDVRPTDQSIQRAAIWHMCLACTSIFKKLLIRLITLFYFGNYIIMA